MKHQLFLFDLDDTLLDFRASEDASFQRTMAQLGLRDGLDALFAQYQVTNLALWRLFEQGAVSKDFLRIERFREPGAYGIDIAGLVAWADDALVRLSGHPPDLDIRTPRLRSSGPMVSRKVVCRSQ